MNAIEVVRMARAAGIGLALDGDGLLLEAASEPRDPSLRNYFGTSLRSWYCFDPIMIASKDGSPRPVRAVW